MFIKKIRENKTDINSFTKLYKIYKEESNINQYFADKEAADVLGDYKLNILLFNTKVNGLHEIPPVGFCIYKENRTLNDTRITEVLLLFVPQKYSGNGIYEKMLSEVKKLKKENGVVKMHL